MAVRNQFVVPPAMMGMLEKTLKEIVQDSTFYKIASQKMSLSSAEIETRLSIVLAITNKCLRTVVALCALRSRALARRNTILEASMTAWVDLLSARNQEVLDWITVGATPAQMIALQQYGITPEHVEWYLSQTEGKPSITRLVKDPRLAVPDDAGRTVRPKT
jgi:hypothetical protein